MTIPATTNTTISTWVGPEGDAASTSLLQSFRLDHARAAESRLKAVSDAVLAVASRAVGRRGPPTAGRLRARARRRALRRARHPGRRGRLPALPGRRDERRADRGDGPLPRTHGMLGAMLETDGADRTDDIHHDPRFRGWWPRAHPDMRSFLGVPIVAPDEVIGAFYLTEKEGARQFDAARPGADRAARRPRRDRHHQRPALRAQPRAVDPVGAQPAGARAARRRQPEAVQPHPQPPRPPRRCWTATPTRPGRSSSASASWPARRWPSCAR